MKKRSAPLPSKQDVIDFIKSSSGPVGKREIARAFHLTGDQRLYLKDLLKEISVEKTGVDRGFKRRFGRLGDLPEYTVLRITGVSVDGMLEARPQQWDEEAPPPRILITSERRGETAAGPGDSVLAKLRRLKETLYEGHIVRRLVNGPRQVLGVVGITETGQGRLYPTDRREKADYILDKNELGSIKAGELVMAEVLPSRGMGLKQARVTERLGDMNEPRSISLLVIHTHGIPFQFPEDAEAQAQNAKAAALGEREDLRSIPLVTIDGEDARDFDDAVWAEPDPDPANAGGWHAIVAIADVAWYVRPGDALDKVAFERGNSVYFPDRVVPMLPEALSNGWCSLVPHEDRPCLCVHLWINKEGTVIRHRFARSLMRSSARLTYTSVQNAIDGFGSDIAHDIVEGVLKPLYAAWHALQISRKKRGVLELDLPERQVMLGDDGKVAQIFPRARYDSHRLIEDFMITANVAAAETLEKFQQPCMYRVHDRPSLEKLDVLRRFIESMDIGVTLADKPQPSQFNQILAKTAENAQAHLVSEMILRSQAQAAYSPDNIGHFGLHLDKYAHFTSPIRRYSDLLVHRALISGLAAGEGGLPSGMAPRYPEIGEHISVTERRAAQAERDAINRYTVAYLSERLGAQFAGRISGVTSSAMFVSLTETGADGIIPLGLLPADHYLFDKDTHSLTGRHTRLVFQLGDTVEVRLKEANALTGSLVFELLSPFGAQKTALPRGLKGKRPAAGDKDKRKDKAQRGALSKKGGRAAKKTSQTRKKKSLSSKPKKGV